MRLSLGVKPAAAGTGDRAVTLALTGLKGGHSGCDIHLQRGNAVCLLARALWAAHAGAPFRLARLEGGSAHNAIPREAFATIVAGAADIESLTAAMHAEFEAFRDEYRPADPGMTLAVGEPAPADQAWTADATATVLRLISSLPHGVQAMSYDIAGLVETSNNVATVKGTNGSLVITTSSRSSVDAELDALRRRIRATGELAGADVDVRPAYPGWKPNMESEVLEVVKQVHARELGAEPEVAAIHAGLECGIIGKKIPGMDMLSFGPVIEAPHSPGRAGPHRLGGALLPTADGDAGGARLGSPPACYAFLHGRRYEVDRRYRRCDHRVGRRFRRGSDRCSSHAGR